MTDISDEQIAEILRRKTAFFAERKRAIGTEYYENRDFWERMWETEWEMLSDRLEKTDDEIQIEPLPVEFPTLKVEGEQLTLYSFDDFALLHNQGILEKPDSLLTEEDDGRKML